MLQALGDPSACSRCTKAENDSPQQVGPPAMPIAVLLKLSTVGPSADSRGMGAYTGSQQQTDLPGSRA